MTLPPPQTASEDQWLESLLDAPSEVLLQLAQEALSARRVRLAGRLVCLLEEGEIAAFPELSRAKKAALFQLHEGGLAHQEMPEDLATLKRRRTQRILRSKNRQRRTVNPQDPRFRRK